MTRRMISDAQMDRMILLEQRRVQLLEQHVRTLVSEHRLDPAVLDDPHEENAELVVGDVIELFGHDYRFIGIAENGKAQLIKVRQTAQRPGDFTQLMGS